MNKSLIIMYHFTNDMASSIRGLRNANLIMVDVRLYLFITLRNMLGFGVGKIGYPPSLPVCSSFSYKSIVILCNYSSVFSATSSFCSVA